MTSTILQPRGWCTSNAASSVLTILVICILHSHLICQAEGSIDCFKCVSLNGSNPECEDPFHNNYTLDLLERPCMGGRKNRNGLFPASSCIKLTGSYADGSGTVMVRGCALDSGTLTTDTEIIRMSHCGHFYFNDKYVHGCVQSCDDIDACNTSAHLTPSSSLHLLLIAFPLAFSQPFSKKCRSL